MPRHSSKTLLPDHFTGSNDFESYVLHFEFFSQLEVAKKKNSKRRRNRYRLTAAIFCVKDTKIGY